VFPIIIVWDRKSWPEQMMRLIAWDLYLFYTNMGYDGSLSMIEDRMDWVSDEAFYGGEEQ